MLSLLGENEKRLWAFARTYEHSCHQTLILHTKTHKPRYILFHRKFGILSQQPLSQRLFVSVKLNVNVLCVLGR